MQSESSPIKEMDKKQVRPHVLLGIPSATCAEGMVENGSWAALTDAFDITLVIDSSKPVDALESLANNTVRWSLSKKRLVAWQAIYLSHQMAHGREFHPEIVQTVIWLVGYAKVVDRFAWLIKTKFFKLTFARLFRSYLLATNPLSKAVDRPVDAVICLTGFKDPLHDDIIRYSRQQNIPSLSIPQNWDNIYYKALLERPDVLGVWGMQGYYAALAMHKFGYASTALVGMSRMDIYRGFQPDQASARKALDLPEISPILLYAAASAPFNDAAILEELDEAIMSGKLPQETIVLFKSHPRRWGGAGLEDHRISKLSKVKLIPETGEGSVSAENLIYLMRAVDGVISPYSTMSLEAALCGRPSANVCYNDPDFPSYDWSLEHTLIHLAPLVKADWATHCSRQEDVLPAAKKIIELSRTKSFEVEIKAAVEHIVHLGPDIFGDRVVDIVSRQLAKSPLELPV